MRVQKCESVQCTQFHPLFSSEQERLLDSLITLDCIAVDWLQWSNLQKCFCYGLESAFAVPDRALDLSFGGDVGCALSDLLVYLG